MPHGDTSIGVTCTMIIALSYTEQSCAGALSPPGSTRRLLTENALEKQVQLR